MVKTLKNLTGLILSVYILSSCTYDNAEEFYGNEACDTLNISFSLTIDPIIDRNCKACHFNGNGTGVTLVTYDDIKNSADNGSLLGAIKHQPGYSPMPKGGKLDDCSIKKIEAWINNGTLND